ncbi:MAG: hypothetical protein ABIJ16_09005 [Bacteroidota bacterium]
MRKTEKRHSIRSGKYFIFAKLMLGAAIVSLIATSSCRTKKKEVLCYFASNEPEINQNDTANE